MVGTRSTYLCLFPLSLVCFSYLYYLFKRHSAKWMCRKVIGHVRFNEVQKKYEKDLHIGKKRALSTLLPPIQQSQDASLVVLDEGDVSEIAQLMVGIVFACMASPVSVIIMWQARQDIILSRSSILVPFAHFGAWYYIVDMYMMFKSFTLRKGLSHSHISIQKRLYKFMVKRWSMLLHHVCLLCIGYPLTVNHSARGGKGDFILGALIAEEFSTPFLSTSKILKLLGLHRSFVYKLTGSILISVFFVVRVLNIPLTFLLYASQYHDWNVMAAIISMTPICHFLNTVQLLLQGYWFYCLLCIAIQYRGLQTTRQNQKAD